MDRSQFTIQLRDAVVAALQEFRERHPTESPYAFAIIQGQCGNYLGYAIATEEGLRRVAGEYDSKGYLYEEFEGVNFDNKEKLATMLRWANPDDGWYYDDFPSRFQIQQHLAHLVNAGAFGKSAEELEEFCTDVLASLQSHPDWQLVKADHDVIVGVTEGVYSGDFIRTATRCNSFTLARRLWDEEWHANDVERRMKRPR